MADLQAMVAHVSAPPTAALTTAGGPRLSGEPLLLDAMTARQLQLLGTVAAVPVAARFLGEPTQLRTLLSLVALGSLRVRRSALRTLRAVLPATPPEVAASAVAGLGRDGSGTGDGVGGGAGAGAGAGAGGDSAPANGVLLFLLDIVGQVKAYIPTLCALGRFLTRTCLAFPRATPSLCAQLAKQPLLVHPL